MRVKLRPSPFIEFLDRVDYRACILHWRFFSKEIHNPIGGEPETIEVLGFRIVTEVTTESSRPVDVDEEAVRVASIKINLLRRGSEAQ